MSGLTYLLLHNPEKLDKLEGEVIDGRWVKGGMGVAVNQFSAGTSELNFHRAREFHPERYLDPPPPEFANDDKAASQPFSMGQRVCIGRA